MLGFFTEKKISARRNVRRHGFQDKKMSIKIGILGYGNLGKGVEAERIVQETVAEEQVDRR